jgi:hypothetical protein
LKEETEIEIETQEIKKKLDKKLYWQSKFQIC